MIFDLHSHSSASDGMLSPLELVSRARAQGVDVLALTDHDTIAGLEQARVAANDCGLELINGIEFSCLWARQGVHIVGLNVDIDSEALQQAVGHQARVRAERAEQIAARLAKQGIEGTLEGARRLAGEGVVTRPHFARYLVEVGAVKSVNVAFKKYLGAGKAGDVKALWPSVEQVVEWITQAGGVAVLAHPDKYKMTRTKLRALLADFTAAGGQAVEVVSGKQQSAVTKELSRMVSAAGLAASCGSDFHVPNQPWQELGQFGGLTEACQPVWHLWGDERV